MGVFVKQLKGYSAFIPSPFPSKGLLRFDQHILRKSEEARARMGHLNGIAHHIPDVDFFIFMYINKDATASSQIEGTNAGFEDVLESRVLPVSRLPEDVDDILHYIRGLNFGLSELENLRIGERLIKSVHENLMREARTTTPNNTPGEFRTSQNWIGTNLPNARFVPPPHTELSRVIGDLEKFIYSKDTSLFPAIQAALIHAQFEAIHPFLDGNGRTGRMLLTLFFVEKGFMEKPLLYLSHYFRRHRDEYYDRLSGYTKGEVDAWVEFFLDAIIEIADESIETIKQLSDLRESDREKIVQLDKRSSENILKTLQFLYQSPVITSTLLQKETGLTRTSAQYTIDKMIELKILQPTGRKSGHSQIYEYTKYIDMFKK